MRALVLILALMMSVSSPAQTDYDLTLERELQYFLAAAVAIPVALCVSAGVIQEGCTDSGHNFFFDEDHVPPFGGLPGYARCTAEEPQPEDFVYTEACFNVD